MPLEFVRELVQALSADIEDTVEPEPVPAPAPQPAPTKPRKQHPAGPVDHAERRRLLESGAQIADIAKQLGLTPRAVHHWRAKYV